LKGFEISYLVVGDDLAVGEDDGTFEKMEEDTDTDVVD
jgi:hypothetical protein